MSPGYRLLRSSNIRTRLREVAEAAVGDRANEVTVRQREGESVLVGGRDLPIRHVKRIDVMGSQAKKMAIAVQEGCNYQRIPYVL